MPIMTQPCPKCGWNVELIRAWDGEYHPITCGCGYDFKVDKIWIEIDKEIFAKESSEHVLKALKTIMNNGHLSGIKVEENRWFPL